MKYKKVYGEYRTDKCIFCGATSISKNKKGFPVCKKHEKIEEIPAYRCFCGNFVDIEVGKFGVYCKCYKCGNINLNKILEINN